MNGGVLVVCCCHDKKRDCEPVEDCDLEECCSEDAGECGEDEGCCCSEK